MGPTPAKVGRIKARDTQTTSPDPWSNTKMGLTRQTAIGPGIRRVVLKDT
jgi:hypothetical protein